MWITTGVDIIEVDRIKKAVEELGDTFLEKVYTEKEIEYSMKSDTMKYQHLAARFAAKEAVFKAISEKVDIKSINWNEIEISNKENGRPGVFLDKLKGIKGLENIKNIDISLSHIKDLAVATAVVTF